MRNLSEKTKYKNIKKLYNIHQITEEGYVLIGNKNICIYKVEPINIINSDDEYKLKVYSTYLTCVKSCSNIQILIKTEKQDFEEQIKFYKRKVEQIESDELKRAMRKYIEYLKEQNSFENYAKQIFLITDNRNNIVKQEMKNFEQNLLNIGVRMNRIKDAEEICKILKELIAREKYRYV